MAIIGGVQFPDPDRFTGDPFAEARKIAAEREPPPERVTAPATRFMGDPFAEAQRIAAERQAQFAPTMPQYTTTTPAPPDMPTIEEGDDFWGNLLQSADEGLDFLNRNIFKPVGEVIGPPVEKVLEALRVPYLKTAHPLIANLYSEHLGLEEDLKASLAEEKQLKGQLDKLKSLVATVDNNRRYNEVKARYDTLRQQNADAQWQRFTGWLAKPVEYDTSEADAAKARGESAAGVLAAMGRDMHNNFVASAEEIAEYERDAPVLLQLGGEFLLDPLNLVALPVGKVHDLITLAKAKKWTVVTDATAGALLHVEELKGIANAKFWSSLSPFRLTPNAQATVLANEATDTLARLSRDTELLSYLAPMLKNPDDLDVIAASLGLSQTEPVKRLVGLLNRFAEKEGIENVGEYVAKLTVRAKGEPLDVLVEMTRKFTDITQEIYHVKEVTNPIVKARDAVNNILSITFMGHNPAFAFRNAANNLVTALLDGVSPFQSAMKNQFWMDVWGIMPMSSGASQTMGSPGLRNPLAAENIRELGTAKSLRTVFRSTRDMLAGKTGSKKGFSGSKAGRGLTSTLYMGGQLEALASQAVVISGQKKFFKQLWTKEIRDMERRLKAAELPPEIVRYIRQGLANSYNPKQMLKVFTDAAGRDLLREGGALGPIGSAIPGKFKPSPELAFARSAIMFNPKLLQMLDNEMPEMWDLVVAMTNGLSTEGDARVILNGLADVLEQLADFSHSEGFINRLDSTTTREAFGALLDAIDGSTVKYYDWYEDVMKPFQKAADQLAVPERNKAFQIIRQELIDKRELYLEKLITVVREQGPEVGLSAEQIKVIVKYQMDDLVAHKRYVKALDDVWSGDISTPEAHKALKEANKKLRTAETEARKKRKADYDKLIADMKKGAAKPASAGAAAHVPEAKPLGIGWRWLMPEVEDFKKYDQAPDVRKAIDDAVQEAVNAGKKPDKARTVALTSKIADGIIDYHIFDDDPAQAVIKAQQYAVWAKSGRPPAPAIADYRRIVDIQKTHPEEFEVVVGVIKDALAANKEAQWDKIYKSLKTERYREIMGRALGSQAYDEGRGIYELISRDRWDDLLDELKRMDDEVAEAAARNAPTPGAPPGGPPPLPDQGVVPATSPLGTGARTATEVDALLDDLLRTRIDGSRRVSEHLRDTAAARVVNLPELTDDQLRLLTKEFDEVMLPRMVKAKTIADKAAVTMRDEVLLDYARRSNLNGLLQWIYPYNFWYVGTYGNWAWRLASNPALVSHYAQLKKRLKEVNQEWYREMTGDPDAEVPDYYARQLRLPWHGNGVWLDFERALNPLQNLITEFNPKERERAPGGKAYTAISGWGPSVFSPLTWAYAAWLNSHGHKEAAQQLFGYISPTSKVIKGVSAKWKEAGLPGASAIPMGGTNPEEIAGLPFVQGGDIWERRRIGYFLARMWLENQISAADMEQAAHDQVGPIWEKAAQMEAVYRTNPNILGYLVGAGFRFHGDMEVQVDRMWKEWSDLLERKESENLQAEEWQQELIDFNDDYPWANAVRMSREFDPVERLADFTWLVLRRIPPGNKKTEAFEASGIEPLIEQFYADNGNIQNWDPRSLEELKVGINKLGIRYDVPTPDQVELFQQAKLNHNHLKELAKDALYRSGYENAQDVEKIQSAFYDLPKGPQRDAFLIANPILSDYWELQRNLAGENADLAATEEEFYTSEQEKLNAEFWDNAIPPGYNWQRGLTLSPLVSAMLDDASRSSLTPEQKQMAIDWLSANVPAKYADKDEWVIARRINDQWKEAIVTAFGEEINDLTAVWGEMSGNDAAKAQWKKQFPGEYALLDKYWDYKDQFGKKYPIWRKYYGFDDTAASYGASSSGSGSRSYYSGGGRAATAPQPAAAPAAPAPSAAPSPAVVAHEYDQVAVRVRSAMATPSFVTLISKLFGTGFLLKLRAWLALSGEARMKWMKANRVPASQIEMFLDWFARQDQTGGGSERVLNSIPPNAPGTY